MSIVKKVVFLVVCMNSFLAYGGGYYVAPEGSDSSDGSSQNPWATITYASGKYSERVSIQNSGSQHGYITFVGENGAVVDGIGIDASGNEGSGLFQIQNQSYIIVDGLTIKHSNHHGIAVGGECSHITIRNCRTDSTDGSGIIACGKYPFSNYLIDNLIIEHNEVHWPQMGRWNGNNCWEEDITLMSGIDTFIVRYNHVNAYDTVNYNGGPIGIDVKEGVKNGVIHHNHVENIPCNGIYVDGWLTGAENIEIYQNLVHCIAGYGINIGAERGGSLNNIKVYNNIVYSVRWTGIIVDDYTGGGTTPQPKTNIEIFNNTVYNSGYSGWGGGILIQSPSSGKVCNNIIAQCRSGLEMNEDDFIVTDNCIYADNGQTKHTGENVIESDADFVDVANFDFHLKETSPCINEGISDGAPEVDFEGAVRPVGGACDIGAYEYGGSISLLKNIEKVKSKIDIELCDNGSIGFTFTGVNVNSAVVNLYTVAGRVVKTVSINSGEMVFFKGLSLGLYIVNYKADKMNKTKKIVLK